MYNHGINHQSNDQILIETKSAEAENSVVFLHLTVVAGITEKTSVNEGRTGCRTGQRKWIMASTAKKRTRKKTASEEVKTSLMKKYRETFIDKLTPQDLEELQCYLMQQYNNEHGWNNEYRLKFEFKLRQYFHEEILKREIASIETLLDLLQPQDLKM